MGKSMSSNCLYDSQEWGTTRLNLVDVDRYLPEEPWPPQLSEGGLDEFQESWPSSSLSNDAPCDTQDPWSWDTAGDESQSQPLGGPGAYNAVVDDLQDLGLQEQFVHIKCETQTMNGQESLTSASGDISSASGDYRDASGDFSGRELVLPSSDVS
ncbi:uncharacterized protein LOC121875390 [Homarus americanus]|uniref:uncharacterized protein LOC121875390 n=1 Tax=Homarus americanus TaxID=6706 RepID=UPI001C43C8B7|nr:uncharacterized protein LOC121875390 [Homarus americanus]